MKSDVDTFMAQLKHPFAVQIQALRESLLNSNKSITEQIKWKAPSFCIDGDDRVTFRLQPKDQCQLIFHRGSKVRSDVELFSFQDPTGWIEWKTNDRGVIDFATPEQLDERKARVVELANLWMQATR